MKKHTGKIIVVAACAAIGSAASLSAAPIGRDAVGMVAEASNRTDTIDVPDMQCGMCEERIDKALTGVKGVTGVRSDAERNQVIVTYDPRAVSLKRLRKAIAGVGYDAGGMKANGKAQAALPGCCKPNGE